MVRTIHLAATALFSRVFWQTHGGWIMEAGIAAMAIGLMVVRPLLYRDPAFIYFDDFYYYLVPARHYLATGSVTFFPGIPTNGFQPLWMALITALLAATGGGVLFFTLLNLCSALLLVAAFHQAVMLAREQGAGRWLSACAGMGVLAVQLNIAIFGMEVVLAVPLLLGLTRLVLNHPLSEASSRLLLAIGLMGSLTVLARLDAVVLLLPLAIALYIADRPPLRALLMIGAGTWPLWAYAALNLALTGMLIPISGLAKQTKAHLWPNLSPILELVFGNGATLLCFAAFPLMGLMALARRAPMTRQRLLLVACMAGFVLYYAAYACISDWQLWPWYGYPLAWLAAVVTVALHRSAGEWVRVALDVICPLLLLTALWTARGYTLEGNPVYQAALAIKVFAREHPGTYAMGDRSGTVGYMLDGRVLQLEGLMGDRAFLQYIRSRAPLRAVLRHYHIDYYIVYNPRKEGGCYLLREPALAGSSSPVMQGRICRAPLMIDHADKPTMIFPASAVE